MAVQIVWMLELNTLEHFYKKNESSNKSVEIL